MMAITNLNGGGWQHEYDEILFAWDNPTKYNRTDVLLAEMEKTPGVSIMYDLPVDQMQEGDIVLIKQANINYGVTYNHARMVTAVNPDGTVDVTEALGTYYKEDDYPNEIVTRDFWDVSEGHGILSYVVISIDEYYYGGIYP